MIILSSGRVAAPSRDVRSALAPRNGRERAGSYRRHEAHHLPPGARLSTGESVGSSAGVDTTRRQRRSRRQLRREWSGSRTGRGSGDTSGERWSGDGGGQLRRRGDSGAKASGAREAVVADRKALTATGGCRGQGKAHEGSGDGLTPLTSRRTPLWWSSRPECSATGSASRSHRSLSGVRGHPRGPALPPPRRRLDPLRPRERVDLERVEPRDRRREVGRTRCGLVNAWTWSEWNHGIDGERSAEPGAAS
jgi:hypothetical protein